ncbi:MAG TPA: hypothetical protein VNQ80_12200 [Parapedobacter sp.]|uniref:hypothetical protein n=1 Tax=Parapedobacter sp. TaxID=1958893 RepID=UPI002BA8EBAC|nr:hypothetical protein [Parapedobacter sp.]HWK58098.1 hypothetical protein [Parapedobacter sp.]
MKTFIIAAVMVAMTVALFIVSRAYLTELRENETLSDAFTAQVEKNANQPLEIIKTITDTVYKQSAATVAPIETTDLSLYVSRGYADTLRQALNIAVNKITRLERFTITLQDSIAGILSTDANGTQWATMADNTFNIRYNRTSNMFYPQVSLNLDVIAHEQKPGLFKRRQVLSTIVANDPRIQISNVRQVNKITLPSRFGIDLFGGAVMTPYGLTYGVGAGFGYRIKEF